MSIDRRMDKDMVRIYNGTLLGHKKDWNNAIGSNMDGPRQSYWEKSDRREIKPMTSFRCGIYKEITQMNLQTERENELMVAGGVGGKDGEKG